MTNSQIVKIVKVVKVQKTKKGDNKMLPPLYF